MFVVYIKQDFVILSAYSYVFLISEMKCIASLYWHCKCSFSYLLGYMYYIQFP